MIVKNQEDILSMLKIQMKNNGISQNTLAKNVGVSRPQITRSLSGKNAMQLDTLFKYLDACNITLDINLLSNSAENTNKDNA